MNFKGCSFSFKYFASIVFVLMLGSGLFAQSERHSSYHELELTPEEEQFILKTRTLTVAYNTSCQPFEYLEEIDGKNHAHGITVSFLRKACARIGIHLKFIPIESEKEMIELAEKGQVDIISGINKDLPYMRNYSLTDSAFELPLYIVSKENRLPVPGETIYTLSYTESEFENIYEIFPKDQYHFDRSLNAFEALKKFGTSKCRFLLIGQLDLNYNDGLPEHRLFPINICHSRNFGVSNRIADIAVPLLNKAFTKISKEEFKSLVYDEYLILRNSIYEKTESTKRRQLKLIYLLIVFVTLALFSAAILMTVIYQKSKKIEFDSVTGMKTYPFFEKNAQKILRENPDKKFLILSLNVDKFQLINETLGVMCGNRILRQMGKYFRNHCSENELCCRFYGDNFIFLMQNPEFFWTIEERVYEMTNMKSVLKDILPEKYTLTFTSSVYYINNPEEEIETMIDRANLARKAGKNNYATHRVIEYTSKMREDHEWNRELNLTMNEAFANEEFEVYFQPKFNFITEKIIGAEALIRWNNPKHGLLSPGSFVPHFEENGFIEKIDKFVLKKICIFLENWNKMPESKNIQPLTISFNLSRCNLYNPNLILELEKILKEHDLGVHKIEVELTETIVMENQNRLVKIMNEIRKAGFMISVDDFGSGYSSLNLLKSMPTDVIKLDKEFLSDGPENTRENVIISSVIGMAKKLNITTVAEGVETKTQSDLLKNIGCDIAQGFFYARPMPESEFLRLLENPDGEQNSGNPEA